MRDGRVCGPGSGSKQGPPLKRSESEEIGADDTPRKGKVAGRQFAGECGLAYPCDLAQLENLPSGPFGAFSLAVTQRGAGPPGRKTEPCREGGDKIGSSIPTHDGRALDHTKADLERRGGGEFRAARTGRNGTRSFSFPEENGGLCLNQRGQETEENFNLDKRKTGERAGRTV